MCVYLGEKSVTAYTETDGTLVTEEEGNTRLVFFFSLDDTS